MTSILTKVCIPLSFGVVAGVSSYGWSTLGERGKLDKLSGSIPLPTPKKIGAVAVASLCSVSYALGASNFPAKRPLAAGIIACSLGVAFGDLIIHNNALHCLAEKQATARDVKAAYEKREAK